MMTSMSLMYVNQYLGTKANKSATSSGRSLTFFETTFKIFADKSILLGEACKTEKILSY